MPDTLRNISRRRSFLKFLAASPVLMPALLTGQNRSEWLIDILPNELIQSADQALNVFDLHKIAKMNLSQAHYGYLATGTNNNETLTANRVAFDRYRLKARRLAGVRQPDTSIDLFGKQWETPLILAPVGSQKMYHPEGEIAVARAAKSRKHLLILSTMSATAVDDVSKAHGEPVWFQLYPTNDWKIAQSLVRRAEQAGCPVVAVTVDRPAPRKMEFYLRSARNDPTDCTACHSTRPDQRSGPLAERLGKRPNLYGIDLTDLNSVQADALTWDFVTRLKENTSMKVVLKGIVSSEDAKLCLRYGADGIIVSNHGGRSEASGRATLESLSEVVSAVQGKIPVIMDSGIRRGTDIFKALALGADAVAIGRPYIWGLASFGQAGVEVALDILRTELEIAMKAHGVKSIGELNDSYLVDTLS